MKTLQNPLLLGTVGGAHGIRGEVRVKSFTADPRDLGAYGPLTGADGKRYTVTSARLQKTVVVVRFSEIADRNAAERLNGLDLYVERAMLPEGTGEDEYYEADLIGLKAVSTTGETIGTVLAHHDFGAGELLEIEPPKGASVMIPFSRIAVPEIDVAGGRIVVEMVAAGLKDAILVREGDEQGEGEEDAASTGDGTGGR